MAKKQTGSSGGVYRVTEIIGTSTVSWEDAARTAIETAAKTLRDLRVAEVGKLDVKIENGKVVAFRTRVSLSFKYEDLFGGKGAGDKTVESTRRLFYVTASRAKESLALVAYSSSPERVRRFVLEEGWFSEDEVVDDVPT